MQNPTSDQHNETDKYAFVSRGRFDCYVESCN